METETLTQAGLASPKTVEFSWQPSRAARGRLLSRSGEPLFIAGWKRVLMLHFEVDAAALQRAVPYVLDLHEGRAFVSLVAFTMEKMRPRFGGKLAEILFQPIATHDFLNVRTYVVHGGEPGIHFMAEWLSNRLAVLLGPRTFGLPYRHGKIAYILNRPDQSLAGQVADVRTGAQISFKGGLAQPPKFAPCESGSLTEWLMERYTAFNIVRGRRSFFRVWHPSWPQCNANICLECRDLITTNWPWFEHAHLVGANYSPGFDEVWMGRPHRIPAKCLT